MAISVQYKTGKPGDTLSFPFDSSVVNYVTGVAYWSFTYGSKDHHIQKLSLSLINNKLGNEVTSTINAQMTDDNGHNLDKSSSSVTVCCIAVLGNTDGNISLGSANGINNNSASGPISIPAVQDISQAFLSGFNLGYSNDHHVSTISMAAGLNASGTTAEITSSATMYDSNGHSAETAQINGSMVVTNPSETGILARALLGQNTSGTVDVDFGQPLSGAVVMLQSLAVSFGGDHHVKKFGGGTTGWTWKGNTVTLNNAQSFITDNSNHSSTGDVSLIVFAIPA